MWKQGETRMGGCFLSSGTAHKHTHTITNNNDPAKTSQQQTLLNVRWIVVCITVML